MCKAIIAFRDIEDGHIYQPGDVFPHDGREISPERLNSLLSGKNRLSKPVIEQDNINIPEEPETVQKPVKRRKKKE